MRTKTFIFLFSINFMILNKNFKLLVKSTFIKNQKMKIMLAYFLILNIKEGNMPLFIRWQSQIDKMQILFLFQSQFNLVDAFSWGTTFDKHLLVVCLPRRWLLSGLFGMWSFMKIHLCFQWEYEYWFSPHNTSLESLHRTILNFFKKWKAVLWHSKVHSKLMN